MGTSRSRQEQAKPASASFPVTESDRSSRIQTSCQAVQRRHGVVLCSLLLSATTRMPAMTPLSLCSIPKLKNNAGKKKKKLKLNIILDTVINDKEYMHFKVKPDFELRHRVCVFLSFFPPDSRMLRTFSKINAIFF